MSSPATIRILGIDPGLRITGFGVLDKVGQKLVYVASGCIKIPDDELPARLKTILDSLREVIAQHQPQQVAVEKVFVNVNPQSTLMLGQARGAAICAAVLAQLPVAEYTALQVKQAVVATATRKRNRCRTWCSVCWHYPAHPARMRQMRWPARSAMRMAGRVWGSLLLKGCA